MRHQVLRPLLAAAVLVAAASAQMQEPPSHVEPVNLQSGLHDNPSPVEGLVWSQFVFLPQGTPWLRLRFLGAQLGVGSWLRITSVLDGAVMTMRQEHFAQWNNTSAYFNGNAVMIELFAGPGTTGNHVDVLEAIAGDVDPSVLEPDTICGQTDDRVPSSDPRVGRLSMGCTGWLINVPAAGNNKLHLAAGHCVASNPVLSFAVPSSGANCALAYPPPSKQFAIDTTTMQSSNGGVGNDWWVYRCFPNSTTGRTSFEEQGAAFTLAAALPATGTTLRNYGYGLDGTNVNNATGANGSCSCSSTAGTGTRNQTQQTHTGAVSLVSGTALYHTIDTCGGNSGSVLSDNATGVAVAIHTNAGCSSTGGANSGTAVTNTGLRAAVSAMSAPTASTVTLWATSVPETSSPASTTPWANESYAAGAESCNDCNTSACQYSTNSTNGNTTPLRAVDFQAFSLPAGMRITKVQVETAVRYDQNTTANVGFRAFLPTYALNSGWRNSASFTSGTLCAPRLGTAGDITSLSSNWTAAMINDLQFEVRRQSSLSNNTLRVVSIKVVVTISN